jgi:hypothetical protein
LHDSLKVRPGKGTKMKRVTSAVFILLLCSVAVADMQRHSVPIDNSPQKGPEDAPVTIIEFLDFQ